MLAWEQVYHTHVIALLGTLGMQGCHGLQVAVLLSALGAGIADAPGTVLISYHLMNTCVQTGWRHSFFKCTYTLVVRKAKGPSGYLTPSI
eukprot:1155013-Pelagomonas_calceolata.AAC.2